MIDLGGGSMYINDENTLKILKITSHIIKTFEEIGRELDLDDTLAADTMERIAIEFMFMVKQIRSYQCL